MYVIYAHISRAKRLLTLAQNGGASEDPYVRLLMAKAHLGLGELEDSSREAQKVIAGTASGVGFELSRDAYVVRAEALAGLGITEQAVKYLVAALQLDPDNQEIARKLKALKRLVADTARVRGDYDRAMAAKSLDKAIAHCAEGLQIDRTNKKVMAEMHMRRARAYQALARAQLKAAAPASLSLAAGAEAAAEAAKEQASASWRRCIQDASSVLYYEGSNSFGTDTVNATVLKATALQGLGQFEEAVTLVSVYYHLYIMHIINKIPNKMTTVHCPCTSTPPPRSFDILHR
jgi:tetratricopeptide (TPR) repeat protein